MAAIHMRLLGYSVTLVLHGYNLVLLNRIPVTEDHDIRTFTALYKRFFTVWTVTLTIIIAMMGFATDYLTLKYSNKQEPWLLVLLRRIKNRVFAAVLWPTAFLTSTMFWSLYFYDRSLIYPLFADKILTSTSNHIMHTAVIPIMVWEAVFQPRPVPKNHKLNMTMLSLFMFTYLGIMCYTYYDQGVWMYPVFGLAYNTNIFCFALSIAIIGVALITYYHMQWVITRIVWGSKSKKKQ